MTFLERSRHFFHVVSNIRPIVWIGLYVSVTPMFALLYWALPDSQFRIPDGASTDFGSWLYYSIVTITTLGFGDYTPAHGWAQALTAVEVMCGLIFLGFFLNAVGSMKSEIDVESEMEKNRMLHERMSTEKLVRSIPTVMHLLNTFLAYCYAVTTPIANRDAEHSEYNPGFRYSDMADMFRPSGLPIDHTGRPAVAGMLRSADRASLCLDSLQSRIDMTIWPDLLEDCFSFVANCQVFEAGDAVLASENQEKQKPLTDLIASGLSAAERENHPELAPVNELYAFLKSTADTALRIEAQLTRIAAQSHSMK